MSLEWNFNRGKSKTAEEMFAQLRNSPYLYNRSIVAVMPHPAQHISRPLTSTCEGIYPVRTPILVRPLKMHEAATITSVSNHSGMSQIARYLEFNPSVEALVDSKALINLHKLVPKPSVFQKSMAKWAAREQQHFDRVYRQRVAQLPTDHAFLANVVSKAKYYL
ncbi:hypothetical protein [Pseudomonas phage D6]|nr:hypothetical protein [Pseudomonas phage D6]